MDIKKRISTPLSLKNITVEDSFWKEKMQLVRTEVIPYQWEILNDRIAESAPSFCMHNFKVAGKLTKQKAEQGMAYEEPKYTYRGFELLPEDINKLEDKFYGFLFQDSDFSKWIEAVAYSLMNHPDSELENIADSAIEIVCAAQQENGYLDTYYIINGMDKIFTNLKDHHELYCFGHLTEGAVAYYQATGKDKLLHAAMRFADYIDSYFGIEKCNGYPGHEVAEMALIRLYEVTGEERYLKLSAYFIEQRGKHPYYWDREVDQIIEDEDRYKYYQAHRPIREQDEAVGHSVRAMYLYSGMTDIVKYTGERDMWEACRQLWKSTVHEKMYITGGIGATNHGEAFSFPFDLPNDMAYAETCASIGLIFWASRMLEVELNAEYADIMELALYNTVLSGMALDGKSFFYVNPLEVVPEACHKDHRKQHVKTVRQRWFSCACCPPNLARLVMSLPSYAHTENEDTLYIHLYMGGTIVKEVEGKNVEIKIESEFPWNGRVRITVQKAQGVFLKLVIRIPGWCKGYKPQNIEQKTCYIENGYFHVEGIWNQEETVELDFPMVPRVIQADTRVREDVGKAAIMKGPIVYCMEERDNGNGLHLNLIHPQEVIEEGSIEIQKQVFKTLLVKGMRRKERTMRDYLYQEYRSGEYEEKKFVCIPYFAWGNRGENEMAVWMNALEN